MENREGYIFALCDSAGQYRIVGSECLRQRHIHLYYVARTWEVRKAGEPDGILAVQLLYKLQNKLIFGHLCSDRRTGWLGNPTFLGFPIRTAIGSSFSRIAMQSGCMGVGDSIDARLGFEATTSCSQGRL
jgi:hypothetical protein